jgi:hypothetical protein
MTLKLFPPCPTIVATVDTRELIPYGHKYTVKDRVFYNRLVWITGSCYNEFTLTIGTETIFESTPSSMIDHVVHKNKTAYIYESNGVSGNILINGNGCNDPIHIYT